MCVEQQMAGYLQGIRRPCQQYAVPGRRPPLIFPGAESQPADFMVPRSLMINEMDRFTTITRVVSPLIAERRSFVAYREKGDLRLAGFPVGPSRGV